MDQHGGCFPLPRPQQHMYRDSGGKLSSLKERFLPQSQVQVAPNVLSSKKHLLSGNIMSTATMMESSRTFSNNTTVGFVVRSQAHPAASPFSASALEPQSAAAPAIGNLGSIAAASANAASAISLQPLTLGPKKLPAQSPMAAEMTVRSPQSAASSTPTQHQVQRGWKGLLEISRNSGASGVLGCKAAMDEDPSKDAKLEVCCTAHTSPAVRRLVKGVIRGLKACQDPEKALEGMGGTYFFMNENGRKVAILKPCDEEPLAPNNPKGYVGRMLGEPGWKPTVRVGEAAMREVAAYLLDHDGWAKVPTTALVRARHSIFCYNNRMSSVRQSSLDLTGLAGMASGGMELSSEDDTYALAAGSGSDTSSTALPMKLGSLQEFVTHMCDTSEMGPSKFSAKDVHRIGILDIRLFNTDRHAGNLLVRVSRQPSTTNLRTVPGLGESAYELIPIDHGFCLPETLEACYFEWLHWPQAMLPFSEEELQYIDKIDIEADKQLLQQELPNLRPECLRVMEVATTLLKRGAAAGLSLYEIASVMTRPYEGGDEEPSELEKLAAYAQKAMQELEAACCDDVIEEDESEGTYNSEDDNDAADSETGVYNINGGQDISTMYQRPLLKQSSSREEESMLFDLEEEGNAHGHGYNARGTPRAAQRLQAAPSLGSSLSSSADEFTFGIPASPNGMVTGTPGAVGANGIRTPSTLNSNNTSGPQSAVPMATSVHATDGGFLWRRFKARSAVKRANHHKRSAGGAGGSSRISVRQSYPPPVAAFSPESLNGLFTDMDDAQWKQYMAIWCDALESALVSGAWKKSLSKDSSVAQSCPRF